MGIAGPEAREDAHPGLHILGCAVLWIAAAVWFGFATNAVVGAWASLSACTPGRLLSVALLLGALFTPPSCLYVLTMLRHRGATDAVTLLDVANLLIVVTGSIGLGRVRRDGSCPRDLETEYVRIASQLAVGVAGCTVLVRAMAYTQNQAEKRGGAIAASLIGQPIQLE